MSRWIVLSLGRGLLCRPSCVYWCVCSGRMPSIITGCLPALVMTPPFASVRVVGVLAVRPFIMTVVRLFNRTLSCIPSVARREVSSEVAPRQEPGQQGSRLVHCSGWRAACLCSNVLTKVAFQPLVFTERSDKGTPASRKTIGAMCCSTGGGELWRIAANDRSSWLGMAHPARSARRHF